MPCYAIAHHITSYHIISHHIISHHITSHPIISHHITSWIITHHTTPIPQYRYNASYHIIYHISSHQTTPSPRLRWPLSSPLLILPSPAPCTPHTFSPPHPTPPTDHIVNRKTQLSVQHILTAFGAEFVSHHHILGGGAQASSASR